MGMFAGAWGYSGNEQIQTPSGGGAFKYSDSPTVPGIYSGSCPGDPGCPGREVERSGSTGWSDVAKTLVLTGATAVVNKYLSKPGTPGEKSVPVRDKGNQASSPEPIRDPFWDMPESDATKDTPAGPSLSITPQVFAVLALAVAGFIFISARR